MTNTTTLPLEEWVKARIANLEELLDTYTDVVLRKAVTAKIQENRDFLSMIDKTAKELERMKQETHDVMMGSNIPQLILAKNAFNAALALLISQK